jgi:hypothetical protein
MAFNEIASDMLDLFITLSVVQENNCYALLFCNRSLSLDCGEGVSFLIPHVNFLSLSIYIYIYHSKDKEKGGKSGPALIAGRLCKIMELN